MINGCEKKQRENACKCQGDTRETKSCSKTKGISNFWNTFSLESLKEFSGQSLGTKRGTLEVVPMVAPGIQVPFRVPILFKTKTTTTRRDRDGLGHGPVAGQRRTRRLGQFSLAKFAPRNWNTLRSRVLSARCIRR